MKPKVVSERQQRRLKDLELLSRSFSKGRFRRLQRTMHQKTIDRALKMMNSDQLNAFLIKDEPQAIQTAYGDTLFGRGCLVARRLVEQGVRAVEVTLNGFDTHVNNHEGHITQSKILDPAFASLINDLRQRDLLKSTVVLCIGEFGRTPKINALGGRDHWPHGFSCVLGGGGLRSGLVIGETSATAEKKPPANPIQIPDLYATVLKTLGVDYQKEFPTPVGRPIRATFETGKPIARLLR